MIAALFAALLLLPALPAAAAGSCSTVAVPVALAPGQAASQTVSALLCEPPGGVHPVDVLVHGATYDSSYWDWPQDSTLYSYAKKTIAAGRAVFAFDRLGTGASSRPPSVALSVGVDAYVLHQLLNWLQSQDYEEMTVIGHSLGSMIAIAEAAAYHDADRLVVTGIVHPPGLGLGAPSLFGSFYPAALDPQFFGSITDLGYLTTRPGTRGGSFYSSAASSQVIAYDEAHKDVVAATELESAVARLVAPAGLNDTNQVNVPVLVVMGQLDVLVCEPLLVCTDANILANETPYYSAAPSLTAAAIPDTGHCLTLHPSADLSFARIDEWIAAH